MAGATYYDRLLKAITQMSTRLLGDMVRVGTVHEVQGDKMRVQIGNDHEGQPVLSPWLNTGNHRGGARERRFYKKGQNVMIISPGGNVRNGMIMPYAPNKDFKPPDHASSSGQDEETYQLEDLRVKKTKTGYDIWLEPEKSNQSGGQGQGGGGLTQMPADNKESSGKNATHKIRLNKNGGITVRMNNDRRVMVHKQGVKMKSGKQFAIVLPDKLLVSKEWELAPSDPIPDDDE